MSAERVDDVSERIIGCAIEVHRYIGPGLLESVYESALSVELTERGLHFERQKSLPVIYKGSSIGEFRIDLLVEGCVIVELKSVERMDPIFSAQLLSYMRPGGYPLGLLINFNPKLLKDGVKRLILSPH